MFKRKGDHAVQKSVNYITRAKEIDGLIIIDGGEKAKEAATYQHLGVLGYLLASPSAVDDDEGPEVLRCQQVSTKQKFWARQGKSRGDQTKVCRSWRRLGRMRVSSFEEAQEGGNMEEIWRMTDDSPSVPSLFERSQTHLSTSCSNCTAAVGGRLRRSRRRERNLKYRNVSVCACRQCRGCAWSDRGDSNGERPLNGMMLEEL